jgi:hypothetical protein
MRNQITVVTSDDARMVRPLEQLPFADRLF